MAAPVGRTVAAPHPRPWRGPPAASGDGPGRSRSDGESATGEVAAPEREAAAPSPGRPPRVVRAEDYFLGRMSPVFM